MIYWMHFDQYDESALRSLEINMAIIDQAEEVSENVYLTLDSRVGRWDKVEIPEDLLQLNPNWPKNPFTSNPMAPSYMIVLCNPPDEGEFSYIWQRFHPDSTEYKDKYHLTHQYFESASGENKALPPEVLATMMSRDPEWVQRYVYGKFSRGEGAIHEISPLSLLETDPTYDSELFVTPEWIDRNVIKRGNLSRAFDHGSSAPASCTWWSALPKGIYVCYREYYQPNRIISHHRQSIHELSNDEYYSFSVADPQIFKRQNEKNGGFWSVADEYSDSSLGGTPLFWQPADNNEFATRNRINELLAIDPELEHPVTGKKGSPRLFFIKKSKVYPHGVYHAIRETASQKKALIGTVNGKNIYGDDRDEAIDDHAYDTVRYQCATHLAAKKTQIMKPRPNSFIAMRNRIKSLKSSGYFDRYGMPTL